jgi:hypothetical protein
LLCGKLQHGFVEGEARAAYQATAARSGKFDEVRHATIQAPELPIDPARDRELYRANGYVLLKRLFDPRVLRMFHGLLHTELNLIRSQTYVRNCNLLTKPSIEVYSGEYPPIAAFLWALTPRIAQIAGCEIVPSYGYFRIYQQGDLCRVHSDRQACEHSLSLTVELSENIPWALCIEERSLDEPVSAVETDFGENPFSSIPMSAGDAVMYRGVHHRHGRLEANPNSWSAHLFLHWVDANGRFADHAFDQVQLETAR